MRSRRLIVSWRVSFTPISTRVTKLPKTSSSNCRRHTTYFQIRRIENSTMSTARTGVRLKPEPQRRRLLRDGNVLKERRADARVDLISTTLISDASALAAQEASTSSKRCLEARAIVVHVVVAGTTLKLNSSCRLRKRIMAVAAPYRCRERSRSKETSLPVCVTARQFASAGRAVVVQLAATPAISIYTFDYCRIQCLH